MSSSRVVLFLLSIGLCCGVTSCASPKASDLVSNLDTEKGWGFVATCNKQHNGLWNGWESPVAETMDGAKQLAREHFDEFGHNARVRRAR